MPTAQGFPTSRPDRGDPVQSQSGLGTAVALPRARVWPFLVGTSGAARTTVVSPPMQTPCMVWELSASLVQAGSGAGGLSLLYSTDDSGEQTAGAVAKPSGTPVFEPIDFRSNVVAEVDEIPEHISTVGEGGTAAIPIRLEMKKIIDVPGPIFFKVSLRSGSGEVRTRGILTIFEASSLDQLANFL